MSKKNSSVNLKSFFRDSIAVSQLYQKFKYKVSNLKKRSFVIAISGGPDSLALAALFKAYSYDKKIKIYYVLINHNIRKNSLNEAHQVKKLLKKQKINLNVLSNRKSIIKNIQGNARKIRYNLLADFCKKKRAKTVVTAHNLEDQVETFFIRLSRGSGLTGLSGMKSITKLKGNINLYRPLLDTNKKILVEISRSIFGRFIVDPSNNNKKFLRTKIRLLKRPLENSGIDYNQIIKSINNLASSNSILDEYLENIFGEVIRKEKNLIKIDLKKFRNLKLEIKIKVINRSIKSLANNYYNLRAKKVINLIENFEHKNFIHATLGGCIFKKKNGQITLKIEKK